MARYIDAEEFLDLFYVAAFKQDKLFVKTVEMVVDDTPTAEVEEVKHGQWIEIAENSTGKLIYCTNCDEPINPNKKDVELKRAKEKPDYCPRCGAKMDGGGNAR